MTRRGRLVGALLPALLWLCAAPGAASAQVFITSKPRPEFWIAPVFITANVRSQHVALSPPHTRRAKGGGCFPQKAL